MGGLLDDWVDLKQTYFYFRVASEWMDRLVDEKMTDSWTSS